MTENLPSRRSILCSYVNIVLNEWLKCCSCADKQTQQLSAFTSSFIVCCCHYCVVNLVTKELECWSCIFNYPSLNSDNLAARRGHILSVLFVLLLWYAILSMCVNCDWKVVGRIGITTWSNSLPVVRFRYSVCFLHERFNHWLWHLRDMILTHVTARSYYYDVLFAKLICIDVTWCRCWNVWCIVCRVLSLQCWRGDPVSVQWILLCLMM